MTTAASITEQPTAGASATLATPRRGARWRWAPPRVPRGAGLLVALRSISTTAALRTVAGISATRRPRA